MKRKLFCQISPLCYDISVWKGCMMRRLRDCLGQEHFCREKSRELLPVVIYRHKSLILRRLGNVDMRLQENKAVNLSLAAPHIDGVLIRPGETFSLWRLVGRTCASHGYREGLMIKQGVPSQGIGGGLCQLSNLIHWLVLHSPLEITERHHHDGFDLFPDFGRQVPFGVGTSISYNYLDYRFKNTTEQTYQLLIKVEGEHLCGELRAEKLLDVKYHIQAKGENFVQEGEVWYRVGEVWRNCIDKASGQQLFEELLQR
ncbi:MAG: VanW family protein, partial [Victivallales bacterium]|nr:VanW family protein [Victivallales bacterium]